MGAKYHSGVTNFDPMGMVSQDLCSGPLEIAKYLNCGPHGFRGEDF